MALEKAEAMSSLTCESPLVGGVESDGSAMRLRDTWDRCCRSLCRYFSVRTTGDVHLVDDLMQQLWLKANLSAGTAQAHDVEPWLWRIAQNLLREHRRNDAARLERRAVGDPGVARDLARRFESEQMPPVLLGKKEVRDQLLLAMTSLPAEIL